MQNVVKLYRIKDKSDFASYQTEPIRDTGTGRFQVYKTDNANARWLGRRPRWTVRDLFGNHYAYAQCDTLAEIKEWIAQRLAKEVS